MKALNLSELKTTHKKITTHIQKSNTYYHSLAGRLRRGFGVGRRTGAKGAAVDGVQLELRGWWQQETRVGREHVHGVAHFVPPNVGRNLGALEDVNDGDGVGGASVSSSNFKQHAALSSMLPAAV